MGHLGSLQPAAARPSRAAFLVLRENRFAYTGLERLLAAECPSNCVYVYGPAGVGKSHLIQQFLGKYRSRRGGAAIAVTASEFAAQIAEAADKQDLAAIQQLYREADLLVVEDLQGVQRRPETQRQLVCVIDAIQQRGGTLVFTAADVPGSFAGLQPRLVSRCRAGIVAGMQLPASASRLRLLSHMAQTAQFPIPIGVLRYLADHVGRSPRELAAVLQQLEAVTKQSRTGIIDQDTVRRWLDHDPAARIPTLTQITRAVARHFKLTVGEMRSPSRGRIVALARHCAMFLARELTHDPLCEIADYFGRKNHTTVSYACRQIRLRAATTPTLRSGLMQICLALGVAPIHCA